MLILTRKKGQKTVMTLEDGRQVYVSVMDINGFQAKIGIEAPEGIHIVREELLFRDVKNVRNRGSDRDRGIMDHRINKFHDPSESLPATC